MPLGDGLDGDDFDGSRPTLPCACKMARRLGQHGFYCHVGGMNIRVRLELVGKLSGVPEQRLFVPCLPLLQAFGGMALGGSAAAKSFPTCNRIHPCKAWLQFPS